MQKYHIEEINNWLDFVGKTSAHPFKNWAFRGQGDSRWQLSSCLYRYLISYVPDRKQWEDREWHNLRVFRRRAHLLLERVPEEENEFEWWALMQHHGAPTRLIDFTWSPYVAAFFALEKATEKAAVWALNPGMMENITSSERLPLDTGSKNSLWYGEPFILNQRLVAQQGTFVIARSLTEPIDEIVDRLVNAKQVLAKFILPVATVRKEAMRSLYRMNITQRTLFPGIDGFARSMGYELEFKWYE